MRGIDEQQSQVFSYLSPEARVRKDHPLRHPGDGGRGSGAASWSKMFDLIQAAKNAESVFMRTPHYWPWTKPLRGIRGACVRW